MNKSIFLGLILGVLYSLFILPKKEGHAPNIKFNLNNIFFEGMMIIKINKKKALHIHHWIMSLIVILFIKNSKRKKFQILKGFFYILFLQGLTYKDKFKILCKNPY